MANDDFFFVLIWSEIQMLRFFSVYTFPLRMEGSVTLCCWGQHLGSDCIFTLIHLQLAWKPGPSPEGPWCDDKKPMGEASATKMLL